MATKKELTAEANRHLRFGHFVVGPWEAYVTCPRRKDGCTADVHGFKTHEQMVKNTSWTPVLRAALVEHLQDEHNTREGQ